MSNSQKIRRITGIAMLTAIAVVLQFVGNVINIGAASINLGLLPIAMAAILYGPFAGLFLGIVNGICVIPGAGAFLAHSVFGTIVVCLLKTGVAGFVSGLLFKLFKGRWMILGMFVSALIVPIINSSIFFVGCETLLKSWLDASYVEGGEGFANATLFLVKAVILVNFTSEFLSTLLLTPTIVYVIKIVTKKFNIGDNIGDNLYVNGNKDNK